MGEPSGDVVFRPGGATRARAWAVGLPLLLVLVFLAVITNGAPLLLAPLPLFAVSELWRKAVVTDTELRVQGRLTRRRVALVDVERVHLDRTRRVWVEPRNQQAFRALMIQIGEGGPRDPSGRDFVKLVRERARAAGSSLNVDASVAAQPPAGTAKFFSA